MAINAKYRIPNKETKERDLYHFQTNVDQVVGLGLQRNKEYTLGDIAYAMDLPSYLYLECAIPGTTDVEAPDFTDKKCGDAIEDGTVAFIVKDKRNADNATKAAQDKDGNPIDETYLKITANAASASKISGKTIAVVQSFDASTGTLNLVSLS